MQEPKPVLNFADMAVLIHHLWKIDRLPYTNERIRVQLALVLLVTMGTDLSPSARELPICIAYELQYFDEERSSIFLGRACLARLHEMNGIPIFRQAKNGSKDMESRKPFS
ncbi:hypothetical protein EJ06DRAFT_522931 [Trichodelitschia bisporula]|uniref:Uncharacterized protein n=1 Tax=Trichodelitschia bisporula TaxID=703511 RepID=A0A6G1HS51_9PEZI|nr:hypothetical protein EJ06DRAFT_522931 [Trichodelitschia bisporula]